LFEAGCIQSAFWHRFAATTHSPIGKAPADYGLTLLPDPPRLDAFGNELPDDPLFAINEIPVSDEVLDDATHAALGKGLNKALYNYMHGVGLERTKPNQEWFDEILVPPTSVKKNFIANALADMRARREEAENDSNEVAAPVPVEEMMEMPYEVPTEAGHTQGEAPTRTRGRKRRRM
jgi:hypothetical protein